MSTAYRTESQIQSVTDFGQLFCDLIYTATLAATTDTSLTIPGYIPPTNQIDKSRGVTPYRMVVRISESDEVWIALNAAAAAPAGASFATSTSEIATSHQLFCKDVIAGDVVHFYTPGSTTSLSVALYVLSGM